MAEKNTNSAMPHPNAFIRACAIVVVSNPNSH